MAKEQVKSTDLLNKYEAVVVLHPDTTEDDAKVVLRRNRDVIKQFNGDVHNVDSWGKRRLGNPINKLTRAHYVHMTFETKGEAIAELERIMRINDKVLRFQHTRLDDRISLDSYMDKFKESLAAAINREKEREAKIAAMKKAAQARRMEKAERADYDEE